MDDKQRAVVLNAIKTLNAVEDALEEVGYHSNCSTMERLSDAVGLLSHSLRMGEVQ